MTYNVDVYIDEIWVKTYYNIPGDDEAQAQNHVREMMQVDFSAEENDV